MMESEMFITKKWKNSTELRHTLRLYRSVLFINSKRIYELPSEVD